MGIWKSYSYLGINKDIEIYLRRSIVLSNRIALLIISLTLILIITLSAFNGFTIGLQRASYSILLYASVPLFNYLGFNKLARVLVSTLIPIYIIYLVASGTQQSAPLIYSASYFPPRILTLATCIIPMIVFDTIREKKYMLATSLVCMTCSVGYDFVIDFFGRQVDFYQAKNTFVYYNLVFFIHFVALAAGSFMLKRQVDKTDNRNQELIDEKEKNISELHRKNIELNRLNKEIETQNEEMITQTEELRANHEKLEEANQIIDKQKNELRLYNEQLEELVKKKNRALYETNEELSKYNSELRQFSYTISHNLRAPVARIMGLQDLFNRDKEGLNPNQLELMELLSKSASDLESVISDLTKIIDIRNDVYRVKEKINFETELEKIKQEVLYQLPENAEIKFNFSKAPVIFAIRPLLHSIMHNLISNAIKYRSPERNLIIQINSEYKEGVTVLRISDNGLGIDLKAHGKNIFNMYKRFHTHTDGKGLGLYLVKTQVEILDGNIEVESKPNEGTTFIISFKEPHEIEGQVCFDSEYGSIILNARTNTAGIKWKKQVNSQAYRELFLRSVELTKIHKTPFWIADMRKQGTVKEEDQVWMVSNIFPESVRNGLTHIAGIYDPKQHNESYRSRIKETALKTGAAVEFFTSTLQAESWLERVSMKQSQSE